MLLNSKVFCDCLGKKKKKLFKQSRSTKLERYGPLGQ